MESSILSPEHSFKNDDKINECWIPFLILIINERRYICTEKKTTRTQTKARAAVTKSLIN